MMSWLGICPNCRTLVTRTMHTCHVCDYDLGRGRLTRDGVPLRAHENTWEFIIDVVTSRPQRRRGKDYRAQMIPLGRIRITRRPADAGCH